MRPAVAICLAVAGCAGDPCDAFPADSCVTLEVRGAGLVLEQLALHARDGFPLDDARTPSPLRDPFELPVQLALVPGGRFAGTFELEVRGRFEDVVVAYDVVHGALLRGQHTHLVANLTGPTGGDGGTVALDLAGIDLARTARDFSTVAGDLATPLDADLAAPPGSDLATSGDQAPPRFVVEPSGVTTGLPGVWGFAANDVYIASDDAFVLHSTGNGTWAKQRNPGSQEVLRGVWGPAGNDVFAFGEGPPSGGNDTALLLHSTGNGSWAPLSFPGSDPLGFAIRGMAGTSSDLYAIIAQQDVFHTKDRVTWSRQNAATNPLIQSPAAIWANSGSDLFVLDFGRAIFHSTGGTSWTLQQQLTDDLQSVWGSGPGDIYAAGSTIRHSTGNGVWSEQTNPAQTFLTGLFGASASDVWAVGGNGLVMHSTGDGKWVTVDAGVTTGLRAVWATSSDVFIAGEGGVILHLRR